MVPRNSININRRCGNFVVIPSIFEMINQCQLQYLHVFLGAVGPVLLLPTTINYAGIKMPARPTPPF